MMRSLEIIAVAARTPVGLTAETSAAAVRSGVSRLREFPFVTPQGEPIRVAADPLLDDRLQGRARMILMLESVLDEVCTKLGAHVLSQFEHQTFLALPEARPGFLHEDLEWVQARTEELLDARRMSTKVRVGGRGHAGVFACLERVARSADQDSNLLSLVIGVDSYLDLTTFAWLEARGQLSQPAICNGFTPGEAAACLVVTSRGTRQRTRLQGLASVAGVATALELHTRDSDAGSFGEGISQAVIGAAAALSLPSEAADAVYCDINGERYRSEEWGFFAMRLHQSVRSPAYETPCGACGDVGASTGALGCVLGVQSFVRGYAPGPRVLVMAGSESGLRGALFLRALSNGTAIERSSS